jgi:hypothetical protein
MMEDKDVNKRMLVLALVVGVLSALCLSSVVLAADEAAPAPAAAPAVAAPAAAAPAPAADAPRANRPGRGMPGVTGVVSVTKGADGKVTAIKITDARNNVTNVALDENGMKLADQDGKTVRASGQVVEMKVSTFQAVPPPQQ